MKTTETTIVTPRPAARIRAARPLLVIAAILALCTVVIYFLPGSAKDDRIITPGNATPDGAKALARVLEDHGVDVVTVNKATDLIARSTEDTTAVVLFPSRLQPDVAEAVEGLDSVVYVGLENYYEILEGAVDTGYAVGGATVIRAECESDAALRAVDLTATEYGILKAFSDGAADGWHWCFPLGDDLYAYAEYDDGQRYRAVIPDSLRLRNSTITEAGNAALALNAIGRKPTVLWYFADVDDSLTDPAPTKPGWMLPLFVLLAAALIVGGLGWGRRLGRLVVEDLPTPVPAAEILIGKGRLLRRSMAFDHTATALRSASARRIARRLGVSPRAGAEELHAALTRAGVDPVRAHTLYWGPAPATEDELIRLARNLEALEEELEND